MGETTESFMIVTTELKRTKIPTERRYIREVKRENQRSMFSLVNYTI